MRMVVVFPAPFGPRSPRIVPLGDGEVEPVERTDLVLAGAIDLDQTFGDDRLCDTARPSDQGVGAGGEVTLKDGGARFNQLRYISPVLADAGMRRGRSRTRRASRTRRGGR